MLDTVVGFGQIIIADLILSGDNALVIGMAAAGLPSEQRKKAIFYGMVIAAVLRIVFAVIATYLLGVKGLLFFGSVLLFWVCWKFYNDIKEFSSNTKETVNPHDDLSGKGMKAALTTIIIADVSMSLDNVIAITAIARDNKTLLILGIAFAILIMAVFATAIVKILIKFKWLSYLGLLFLVYLSAKMTFDGWVQLVPFIK